MRRGDDPAALEPALALIFEAVRRTLGTTLYHEQVLAGMAMSSGAIAEMQTGEGKTLAAALPVFWYSLTGAGTHVVTPSNYLAERDCRLLRPAYELLGASVGLIGEDISAPQKQAAYGCDIVYGPGYEFGFDYLRDQLARVSHTRLALGQAHRDLLQGRQRSEPVNMRRPLAVALIDEIDSVLLDEASTPLVLSIQPASDAAASAPFELARKLASQLQAGIDYVLDESLPAARLTAEGDRKIHAAAAVAGLRLERPWSMYVQQALFAQHLLHRDVDYIVQAGQVLLVDAHTGRIFPDRSWRGGLHQAVEAKERLAIQGESPTAAHISRQRYFRLYQRLCGMTGTAAGAEREFWSVYRLPVVVVPPRLPSQHCILPTRFFAAGNTKWQAVVAEVARVHREGRPVLIGTRTDRQQPAIGRASDIRRFEISVAQWYPR